MKDLKENIFIFVSQCAYGFPSHRDPGRVGIVLRVGRSTRS